MNLRVQIEVWTGGSQRNVQTYTYLHGGVKVPSARTPARPARRAGPSLAASEPATSHLWRRCPSVTIRTVVVGISATATTAPNSVTGPAKLVKWPLLPGPRQISCGTTRSPFPVRIGRGDPTAGGAGRDRRTEQGAPGNTGAPCSNTSARPVVTAGRALGLSEITYWG